VEAVFAVLWRRLTPERSARYTGDMANLIDTLKARGVAQAFPLLQLDFSELFERRYTRGNARVYDHHEWVVRDVPVLGRIVNEVPKKPMLEELIWEEWFRKDGKTYHHILTLKRPPRYDDVFVAPEHDDVHPEITLGRTWYVVNDLDMSPVLLRGRSRRE
jgi:hypothetical protein